MSTSKVLENQGMFIWRVRCVDTRTRQLFDRDLLFDPSQQVTSEEVRQAIAVMTGNRRDNEIVRFRHLFREVGDEEIERAIAQRTGFSSFSLHNYFETNDEKQLDEVELISILSGQTHPIILGCTESVLRLGASKIATGVSISQQDSNDITHFIQAVGVIQRGKWWREGASYSSEGTVDCPDVESTAAALTLLRQFLMKRDDTFRVAVRIYLRAVDDVRKRDWVAHELDKFEKTLQRKPFGCPDHAFGGLNCEEIIDVFVYGTGLFHRKSNQTLEDQLMRLRQKYNREQLLFCFHSACREVLSSPFAVAPVMYQDFAHWTNQGMCPRPNRVVAEFMLASSTGTSQISETG